MRKYNDHITVSKVKKAHSMLATAFQIAEQQNGDLQEYMKAKDAEGITGSQAIIDYLSDSLKIEKNCGISADNCRPSGWWSCGNFQKTEIDYRSKRDRCVVLEDGMIFCIDREAEPSYKCDRNVNVCARMHIDINGLKGPNMYSADDFWWVYRKTTKFQPLNNWTDDTPTNGIGCDNPYTSGCHARVNAVRWILLKGNVDYLHKHVDW